MLAGPYLTQETLKSSQWPQVLHHCLVTPCPRFLPLTPTLLQPHWALGCSLNISDTPLPQGLCTGCSLCLEHPSLHIHLKK